NSIIVTLLFTFIPSLAFCQSYDSLTIEKFAAFHGGAEKFYEHVQRNLRYPVDALRDSVQGDVFVEFILDANGEVIKNSVRVLQSLSSSCDEEAIRLIKEAPRWIPARSRSKTVEQQVTFPISFKLK